MGLPCHKKCIHKRIVPGNCHITCMNPDNGVKGDDWGIKNGWFLYPFLFDPIWGEGCANYEKKEKD